MGYISARIVLLIGIVALLFAVVGLANSSLDTRVQLLVALFGAAIAFISVGARAAFPKG